MKVKKLSHIYIFLITHTHTQTDIPWYNSSRQHIQLPNIQLPFGVIKVYY